MLKALGVLMLVLLLSTILWGTTPYLPNLEGVLLEGITQVRPFQFTAGALDRCVHKRAADWFYHQCLVSDSSAQVIVSQASGPYDTITFKKAYVFEKTHRKVGRFVEVVLHGTAGWPVPGALSTDARLILWYPISNPHLVQGSLSLPDLGITRVVQLKPITLP